MAHGSTATAEASRCPRQPVVTEPVVIVPVKVDAKSPVPGRARAPVRAAGRSSVVEMTHAERMEVERAAPDAPLLWSDHAESAAHSGS